EARRGSRVRAPTDDRRLRRSVRAVRRACGRARHGCGDGSGGRASRPVPRSSLTVSGRAPAVPDDLERIETFRHWIEDTTSSRIEQWRFGTALYHDRFPDRWDSNFLRVERPVSGATATELAAEADRALERLRHREFVFDDDAEGARVATGLVGLGYDADRLVYLALRREPDREPPPLEVAEVDFGTVRPLIVQTNLVARGGTPAENAEMLADFRKVLIERVGARFVATRVDA